MKQLVLFSLITFLGIFSVNAQSYSGGSGTSGDPYKIATAADLIDLSNASLHWNKYFIQTADIAFNSDETQVDWDDDGSATWDTEDQKGFGSIGVGTGSLSFSGEYNGNGYSVDYIFIKYDIANIGMFGVIDNGTVKNLNLTNAEVRSNEDNTGALVGYTLGATIENCHTSGLVSGGSAYYTGGLAGHIFSSTNIQNCSSSCSVSADTRSGGFIGKGEDNCSISNCYSIGEVTVGDYGGGFIGIAENVSINNCYSVGSLSGSGSNRGGFVGFLNNNPAIGDCFWDTQTSGTTSSAAGTGKTTAEMKDYNTFTDETTTGLATAWDFVTNPNDDETGNDDYWDMDQYKIVNSGYPILSWQAGADNSLTPFSGGDGTAGNPYQIASTTDLINLSNAPDFWDKYFIQTTDIAFNSVETQVDWDGDGSADDSGTSGFSPIGNNTIKFTGSYDGNGHIIANLYANYNNSYNYGGFFGCANEATIMNLGVVNASVSIDGYSAGILVGRIIGNSIISNCFTSGNVSGDNEVGGLVGKNYYKPVISNCYSIASVSGTYRIGGLVGHNFMTDARITNCYSAGSVNGTSSTGGLVGLQSSGASVDNSFWDTQTSGMTTSAGGTGKTTAQMKDYNTFTDETTTGLATAWDFVTNPNDDTGNNNNWDMDQYKTVNSGYPILSWQAGADNILTPFSGGDGTAGNPYQIATTADLINLSKASSFWNKYFIQTADIAFNSDETQVDWDGDGSPSGNGTSGFSPIGNNTIKFTGEYDGNGYTIDNLFIDRAGTDRVGLFGNTAGALIKNIGVIHVEFTGDRYVGGLVGRNESSATIQNSFSTGNVSGNLDIGGLTGLNYNYAEVNNSYSTCSVSGSSETGGLIGRNYSSADVINSYSAGSVSGSGSNIGGLIGKDDNLTSVENCFWDTQISGQSSSDGGTGKTTAEMTDYNTFTDVTSAGLSTAWDFVTNPNDDTGDNDYWDMDQDETVNNGYPILSWQEGADNDIMPYSGGDGTAGNPYQIATTTDLIELSTSSDDWDKYFIQTADIAFNSDKTQVDWDGNGSADGSSTSGFSPIGNSTNNFTGEYNGDDFSIDYLYFNNNADNIGFFGYLANATVKNIGVTNADVNSTGANTGALAGYAIGSTITECFSTGSVAGGSGYYNGGIAGLVSSTTIQRSWSSCSVSANTRSGGFAGKAENSSNIIDCYSAGAVTVDYYGGGFAGIFSGSTMTNCFSTGLVTGSGTDLGGLIGLDGSSPNINNSFWDTETSGFSTSAGGTGKTTAEMKDYNTFTDESITGLTNAWDFVTNPNNDSGTDNYWDMDQDEAVNSGYPILSWQEGADNDIMPYSGGDGTAGNPYQIATTADLIELSTSSGDWDKYFIQTADIAFNTDETQVDWNGDGSADGSETSGFSPIGNSTNNFTGEYNGDGFSIDYLYINNNTDNIGLFGFLTNATVKNTGVTNADVNSTGANTGALAGYPTGSTITTCYTTGSVTGGSGYYNGGLAGLISSTTIQRSWSSCSVSGDSRSGGFIGKTESSSLIIDCYSAGAVTVGDYGGGFVGIAYSSSFTNCYSSSALSGTGSNRGGFAGYEGTNVSTYNNVFWDTESSGLNTSVGGTGMTTAEMKDYNTFTDESTTGLTTAWDFVVYPNDDNGTNDYWDMDQEGTVNSGYPILSWQAGADDALAIIVWTGTSGNDWHIPSNWDGEQLPAPADDVQIPDVSGSSGNFPSIGYSNSATINNLTVDAGASLTIRSYAAGTGSLIINGSSTGNVSVERYLTADKWHIVGPPVAGQQINSLLTDANNSVAFIDPNYGVTTYSESLNDWDAYFTASTSGNFSNGTGYLFRRETDDGLVSFTGTLATGDVTVPVTLKETGFGWNCIGNPYPSAIGANNSATSATDFLTHNSDILDDSYEALYIWDPTANSGAGDYVIINHAGIGNGTEDAWNTDYVQSGQGFIVRANANGNVEFTTRMQTHQPTQTFKSAEMPWSKMVITVNRNGEKTSTIVAFNDEMSAGLDPGFDAGVFKDGNDFYVYTQLPEDNGVDFGLQCLPAQNIESLEIPIGIDATEGGEITFSLQQENLPLDVIPVLNDKVQQTQTAFTHEDDVYTANINDNTSGYGRFTLTFSSTTYAENIMNNQPAFTVWHSNEKLHIQGETKPGATMALYDVQGRKLMMQKLQHTNRNSISTAGLVSGIYLVNIKNSEANYTTKVIVTK